MEGAPTARAEGPAAAGGRGSRLWTLLLLGLCAWQGWMTLSLFGADQPWERLLDDEPVVSGYHPLHLYHGYLGALSLRAAGSTCCYDPAFQAGYPKTPVFDSGSRPAELALLLAGAGYRPAAYKVGLACACATVPWLLALAAWGAGLGRAATFLATAAGLLVLWGTPARKAVEAGDIDLLLGALGLLAHVGLLLRFDRVPGPGSWSGVLATGWLAWFAHPLLMVLLVPLALVYYLSAGTRHRRL